MASTNKDQVSFSLFPPLQAVVSLAHAHQKLRPKMPPELEVSLLSSSFPSSLSPYGPRPCRRPSDLPKTPPKANFCFRRAFSPFFRPPMLPSLVPHPWNMTPTSLPVFLEGHGHRWSANDWKIMKKGWIPSFSEYFSHIFWQLVIIADCPPPLTLNYTLWHDPYWTRSMFFL